MDMSKTNPPKEQTMSITLTQISGLEIVDCGGYYAIINRQLGNVEYVKDLKTAEAVLVSVAKDRLATMIEEVAA